MMTLSTAAPPQRLVLIINDEAGERALPLSRSDYKVGRAQSCDVRLFDPHVSRLHARITKVCLEESDEPRYMLGDAGVHTKTHSLNGTYINSDPIEMRLLKVGDTINFGPTASATLVTAESLGLDKTRQLFTTFKAVEAAANDPNFVSRDTSSTKDTDFQEPKTEVLGRVRLVEQ